MRISIVTKSSKKIVENNSLKNTLNSSEEYLELLHQFLNDKSVIDSKNKMMDLVFASFEAFNDLHQSLSESAEKLELLQENNRLRLALADTEHSIELKRKNEFHRLARKYIPKVHGAKKNKEARDKATEFIKVYLITKPDVSINKLATIVSEASYANKQRFGRVVSVNAAKSYVREVKIHK
jgi:hypothetical protein